MAQVYEETMSAMAHWLKGDQAWRKKSQSISIHLDVGIEADIIDTGLFVFVHLAQQLHQVLSIKSRQLTVDFPLQTGSALAAAGMTLEDLKHDGLLWADDLIPTTD